MVVWNKRAAAGALMVGMLSLSFGEAAENRDRFSVEVRGDGAPLVVIPGLTSSPRAFAVALDGLNAQQHLITVAGFAGVPAPSSIDPFIAPLAESITDYVDAAEATDVAVIGHSMGGVVAMLAAGQTDRISRVLIVDSVPFLPALFQPGASPERAAASRPFMQQQMANTSDEAWLAQVRAGLPRQARTSEAQELVYADSAASDTAAAKAAVIELMTTDYTEAFNSVDVPVTLLVPFDPTIGFGRDAVLARYEAQYAGVPNLTIRVVENSRHFIMLDQPSAFRAEVEQFLSGDDQ